MGSVASPSPALPGIPQRVELAYLAGLLDRSGGFAAARPQVIGLKITASAALRDWLMVRFGGYESAGCWWLTRQASLAWLLAAVQPYLVVRVAECRALRELVDHQAHRPSYHGDAAWRERRAQLMAAVRARRGPSRPSRG